MLSLEVGRTSVLLDALRNNNTLGIRKLFLALENRNHHDHDHIHHEKNHSPRSPLADWCESPNNSDIDDNDHHHDYRSHLSMKKKNKKILVTSSRHRTGNRDRALTQNDIYFQQLGKYYNSTKAIPSSSSSSSRRKTNQHHRTKTTAKASSSSSSSSSFDTISSSSS